MVNKERQVNFFEDFHLGQVILHGTPRTVSDGDSSLYIALTGARHAMHSAATAANLLGYQQRPLDDLLVFNTAFGKTVPDISLNAVANLGYAEIRFIAPVFSGDTLHCQSTIIGLKENSSRKTGIVYVRSSCFNQDDQEVLSWVRWVMVTKRKPDAETGDSHIPELEVATPPHQFSHPARIASQAKLDRWCKMTGSGKLWEHYNIGDRINHPLGMTIEEADHMLATRLYQNNARAHFDAVAMKNSPFGKRLVYGGHVISVCRALSYDGLENVLGILAINGGHHVSPTVAGDTLFAYTEVLEKWDLPGRQDVGALRLRLVGLKNTPPSETLHTSIDHNNKLTYSSSVVLDLDYTVLMPRCEPDRDLN